MKNLKIVSTLIAALMLTAVAGYASTAKQESTGQYIDGTVITAAVKTAIFNEPSLKIAEINVETFKGTVVGAVLTGGSPIGTVGGAAVGGVIGNQVKSKN